MFTAIKYDEAEDFFRVLAAISDDTGSPGTAISCLVTALGHPGLSQHAQTHGAILPRLAKRIQDLCGEELEREEDLGSVTATFRFCTLSEIQPRVREAYALDSLAERYRLRIPGQEPR